MQSPAYSQRGTVGEASPRGGSISPMATFDPVGRRGAAGVFRSRSAMRLRARRVLRSWRTILHFGPSVAGGLGPETLVQVPACYHREICKSNHAQGDLMDD